MGKVRRNLTAEYKAKIAVEAIRGVRSVNELASRYGVHPTQVHRWKKQAVEGMTEVFSDRRAGGAKAEEELKARLYEQIGKLQVELDWLKKKGEI